MKFKGIPVLRVSWVGTRDGDMQVREGLMGMCPASASSWKALQKNAIHLCLFKQHICMSSVSHTAQLSAPALHVMCGKSTVVLHIQEGTP